MTPKTWAPGVFGTIAITVVALVVGCARPTAAQQMYESRGNARIVGSVRDSATGRPILRANVCSVVDNHDNSASSLCVNPDSLGNFVLAGLPAEENKFGVSCPPRSRNNFTGRELYWAKTLVLKNADTVRIDIVGDATWCDMRPFTVRTGVFEGIYTPEFEASRFTSCDRTVHAAPYLTDAVASVLYRVKFNHKHPGAYYVKWEGTFSGPGEYGHSGMTPYGIAVTRVLVARPWKKSDCKTR